MHIIFSWKVGNRKLIALTSNFATAVVTIIGSWRVFRRHRRVTNRQCIHISPVCSLGKRNNFLQLCGSIKSEYRKDLCNQKLQFGIFNTRWRKIIEMSRKNKKTSTSFLERMSLATSSLDFARRSWEKSLSPPMLSCECQDGNVNPRRDNALPDTIARRRSDSANVRAGARAYTKDRVTRESLWYYGLYYTAIKIEGVRAKCFSPLPPVVSRSTAGRELSSRFRFCLMKFRSRL